MNNVELQFQVCNSVSLAHNALHIKHDDFGIQYMANMCNTTHDESGQKPWDMSHPQLPCPILQGCEAVNVHWVLLTDVSSRLNVNRCYVISYLGHINTAADYDFNRNSAVMIQLGLQPGQGEHYSYRQNPQSELCQENIGVS